MHTVQKHEYNSRFVYGQSCLSMLDFKVSKIKVSRCWLF